MNTGVGDAENLAWKLALVATECPHLPLVRPDAHVGWRGSPSTAASEEWLTGVLDHGHVSRRRQWRAPGRDECVLAAGAGGP